MLDILNSLPVMDMVQLLDMNTVDFCTDTKEIWKFIGNIVKILQIAIPIIIILLATIDLGKAVISGDEKNIKAAQKALISRIIYGVAIFFVVTIIQVIFGLVGNADIGNQCFKCVSLQGCK